MVEARRGRHEQPGQPTGRTTGFAWLLAVALVLGAGGWWFTHRGEAASEAASVTGSGSGCSGSVPLQLATTAGYRSLAQGVADAFTARKIAVDGACAIASVRVATAAELPQLAGSGQPPTAFLTGPLESAVLAEVARTGGSSLGSGLTVAQSVSVVAVPQPVAAAGGWTTTPPTWSALLARLLDPSAWTAAGHPELHTGGVAAAHPSTSAATSNVLGVLLATAEGAAPGEPAMEGLNSQPAQQAMVSLVRQLRVEGATEDDVVAGLVKADSDGTLAGSVNGAFVEERAVLDYNSRHPKVPLVAIYPSDGNPVSDLTLTPLGEGRLSPQARTGIAELQSFLTGDAGRPLIERAGYRVNAAVASSTLTPDMGLAANPPTTRLPAPDGLARYALASTWDILHNPGRFLLVLDTSASMGQSVPDMGPGMPASTKIQLAIGAGITGVGLMPPTGEMGLWTFGRSAGSTKDYRELVPVGPVGQDLGGHPRSDALVAALQGIHPDGGTPLYVTAIAAHQAMVAGYRAGAANVILLISDGRNDSPTGPGLDAAVATLKASTTPDHPVQINTVAYGENADRAALQAIAAATGGKAFDAPDPHNLGNVLYGALLAGFLGNG